MDAQFDGMSPEVLSWSRARARYMETHVHITHYMYVAKRVRR